jgi:hypothetical protein
MTIPQHVESVPQTWDDQCDTAFFRIVASLFPPGFTYGASVLLAGNDAGLDEAAPVVAADSAYVLVVAVTA